MSSLYYISQELLEFQQVLEENEGIVEQEYWDLLVIKEEEFKSKVENYCKFILDLENQIAFAQTEINRINKYIKPKNNLVDRLKDSILNAVKTFGNKDPKKDIWRYETGTFKLGTRSSSSVNILNEEEIEDRFKQVTISKLSLEDKVKILDALGKSQDEVNIKVDISKTAIKEAIDKEELVQGVEIKTNYNIQIK